MNKEIKKEEVKEGAKQILSSEDQKYFKRICKAPTLTESGKLEQLLEYFKVEDSILYEWANDLNVTLTSTDFSKATLHTLVTKKRYLISSAQNASPVNKEFLKNMQVYAKHIDAEIGIIATRYRNPTSIFKEAGDIWAKEVQPYLTAKRQILHNDLLLLADLKIQATSPVPTNGAEIFGEHRSVIVGSPRIEMKSLPVLVSQKNKFLFSTGSVTVPSFTDTVAGGKAAQNHCYGFVVVEIEDDETVHIRNVEADKEGNFSDLTSVVRQGKISVEGIDTLVWGDSHFAQKIPKVTNAFRKLCKDLQIKNSVLHDVWDSQSINVHNKDNKVIQYKLYKSGKDSLKKELKQMYEELDWFEDNMGYTLVAASNHDDMLDRAMVQSEWYDNLKNANIFLKLLRLKLSGKATDGLIPYYINKKYDYIAATGLDTSVIKFGVELAIHGHKGPNGSRGSINSFSKLSTKTIIGHSHSPAIKGGCYQVGVSCSLKHGYNKGLSSWAYNGVILNKYGKRQSITFNKETLTYTTLL